MPEVEVQAVEVEEPAATTPVSALVVPFSLTPALTAIRQRWDYAALEGIGPHVTILYPFLPCAELLPPARVELAAMARAVPAFTVRFERVGRFPDVVWLEPEPADPFKALTAAVAGRWPDHPPYGGVHDTVIPHMTVVESEVAAVDDVEAIARRAAPLERRAERMELWCRDASGRWRTRWRLPLGVKR